MSDGHHSRSRHRRHHYDEEHASSSRRYSRSKRSRSPSNSRKSPAVDDDPTGPTNLLNFSFGDHKTELNRVLLGFRTKDQLVDDVKDLWLFVTKYENLLKKSGQCLLPDPVQTSEHSSSSQSYNKADTLSVGFAVPLEELQGRLSNRTAITELRLRQFLQIVLHYLDFKQREKFNKLQKLLQFQAALPVAQYKEQIIEAVRSEQVVLIAGDTGCGKSTQVPQYLCEAGFRSVACTQPRRIACISLSKRVAHEMLCEYGTEVGYQIRFERSRSERTRILFITEGLLLRQLSAEQSLSQYDVLVLDEVHERHLHGDFLLGVTKCLLRARPELKVILMSATINIQLFADYFAEESVRVIEVPGRLYPIKLHYMPQLNDPTVAPGRQSKTERLSPEPYVQIMQLIDSKYPSTEKGDLLIFMSGLNEITMVVEAAKEYAEQNSNWIILPLHSTLSIADQDKVFDYAPDGMRKCIVSTNIAETSVTIDGIRFVVDSGKVKEMSYDPHSKMQRLKEFWISRASADQRKGRAGRTGPGVCYRLYAQKVYDELEAYAAAEIHRVPLESLLLQMMAMGLPDARMFPFVEAPPPESLENAILSLKQHDALTADEKLTALGKALSRIPVDIAIGKMLLMGCVFQQLQPVLTLAAALSVQSPFTNRAYRDPECEKSRKDLESDHGDPITVLNAYKEWLEMKQAKFNRHEHAPNTKQWCRRRGLEEQRFYEITKLRNQFEDLLSDCGLAEAQDVGELSSGERAIRNGEVRQLRQLRREQKNEAPRKRKLLRSDPWGLHGDGEDDDNDGAVDIRDIEFRLSHDTSKINNLVSGATACSYRDLMTLKLILVSGLYPQIAVADEFNYCKSASQQFFHTQAKPFASLHPMGFFGNNAQILQLTEPDIVEKSGPYKSKLPLSSRHQLLCYLSLLETTKPYLMNTLRMPAAQTLLLFAHTIDTNVTCSRLICDSWLCVDFPVPESGQSVLLKASNLRRSWSKLLSAKLDSLKENVENALNNKASSTRRLEMELWQDLAQFMNTEIVYTLKRLLPADLKTLYVRSEGDRITVDPNPFAEDFVCTENETKGGVFLTETICYGCVNETDWSIQLANDICEMDWECSVCKQTYNLTGMQKLQHTQVCTKSQPKPTEEELNKEANIPRPANVKEYRCARCNQTLYLSSVEILRHKRTCQ